MNKLLVQARDVRVAMEMLEMDAKLRLETLLEMEQEFENENCKIEQDYPAMLVG